MLEVSLQILQMSALVYNIYFQNRTGYQKDSLKHFWNRNQQKKKVLKD